MTNVPDRPNVLLIIADQWSGGRTGYAGHATVQTPTLDQIARNGVVFPRAYSESPICIPARRSLYTGTTPRTHGDRVFRKSGRMPEVPTMAQTFRDAGYQAYCVGKLHVFPERDRIGYDDVLLSEEGRPHLAIDDYSLYLYDQGHAGQAFMHGLPNNNYLHREWHLAENCHVTNWATQQMCRIIKRRDPTRPSFWTLSYEAPHPPLAPLTTYMEFYRQLEIEAALRSDWGIGAEDHPHALKALYNYYAELSAPVLAEMRRAYYALCTHVDHQIRAVLGTLREERELDNTIIAFCSDHGDMLGDFGLYAKRTFYEGAARIPMILMGTANDKRIKKGAVDNRLVGLQDVMPTLLDLADIETPSECDGLSMIGEKRRNLFYGEVLENNSASRMMHDGRHKLIWYPAGNWVQLFDLETDPDETRNLADDPTYASVRRSLETALAAHCYGIDVDQGWVVDGKLVGYDPGPYVPKADRSFSSQRGLHYPQPPAGEVPDWVGFPE
ncbi:MAG: sulfatase-like hydrolase/transferase [Roseibium sp.]|uniref:sulfatase-like hydrolase/transferase n=1 Tax=Roseibium sp. TaxID=1936156 RepID=UPI002623DDD5|nr:sulfatase-like hydrolase/transferase [Roseibium sp.]MCV0424178.1 sulfatase-like hydrolase/transferase [Roseibium sp.]